MKQRVVTRDEEFTLGGFTKYDPNLLPPAFSDDARIEIKTRAGQVQTCAYEPWTLAGWNHTGGVNDILEYRLLRGSMSAQKESTK